MFERYVNSKDNQTGEDLATTSDVFERYVNSKDNQTRRPSRHSGCRLRDM